MDSRKWTGYWIEPVQDDVKEEPPFSLADMFITGKAPEMTPPETRLYPCPLLKRVFRVKGALSRATLFITARGLYKASINGAPVTDALFTPDFTSYGKILMYQTYDVTRLLSEGENVWGIVLADGWYAGRVATTGDSCQFGRRLSVLGELELEYADGTRDVVGTDTRFVSSHGKYVYADIQIGEKQDLRRDIADWDSSVDSTGWTPCVPATESVTCEVRPQTGPQVFRDEYLAPAKIWREDDAFVADFGQVIAGRVRLCADLGKGREVRIQHSEALNEQGRFFMNIVGRNKDALDVFVGRGRREVLEPDFTFHGFRYARITGLDSLDAGDIAAVSVSSATERCGSIITSDARLNRLLENIQWSARANMISIPTDCPQRERMGWTGDIQVFAPTGCFFFELDAFLSRWLDSVMADQLESGEIVDYSPMPDAARGQIGFIGTRSSAGWGDAIIFVPWELYMQYGDKAVLERCYGSMLRWHDFCVKSAAGQDPEYKGAPKSGDDCYIWDTKFHYGDWMLPSVLAAGKGPLDGAKATKDIVATCYLARQSDILAEVADVLGHAGAAASAREYARNIRRVFPERFLEGHGKLTCEYQGAYVLALAFDMVPGDERAALSDHLVGMIKENNGCLDTGFLSVPYLLDALCDTGHGDVAAALFWQDKAPGWFYQVDKGATSIWENWANIAPDGKVGNFSFNHYAYGCVGDWIVRRIGGLRLIKPAYSEFAVEPDFVRGVKFARLSHDTKAGKIELSWTERAEGGHEVEVLVPRFSCAQIRLPGVPEQVCGEGLHRFICD